MNVSSDLQNILATIHQNQIQIDLLTANNTQLVKFLLQTGMIQNMQELEIPVFARGEVQHAPKVLAAPKKQRYTKALAKVIATGKKTRTVTSKKATDLPQSEYLLKYASEHHGRLSIIEFRGAKHTQDFIPSFFATTIYSVLKRLQDSGQIKRLDVGNYELVNIKAASA